MNIAETVKSVMSPPHKAGYPFIIGGVVVALVGLVLWTPLAWLGVLFTLFCLYFFRDPERVLPPRKDVLVAPADGLVVSIEQAVPPAELGLSSEPRTRVAIFLSVLDVHVNRAPISGVVQKIAYHPGLFLSAAEDKASDDNERNSMLLHTHDGREVVVVQIAGLIARRILCEVTEGQPLLAGQRFGIIRFGSRTDLYLPEGCTPLVTVGQRMIGGETVIAEMPPKDASFP
ncbi:phosphatidylserine decarboxylase [Acidocella aminolytica]|jgi:phosphatidylserine decarboxylase|uniref:Phosphatidylserine decarboxylase proenzyme n=1 Tax=Acidocella aminolytica 101 = DSM 11237 TaxID=1120923 RepID=A0A0D6PJQ8_9PROT|nr:phosphatidylserine decarboxylase [Acidocella aminolytica]GAN81019.1 phosphatidylserine decarboxylase [Acidocella aminolytica 101 = DSM 11237]GBQ38515.1 phosphatidylserine decarboxylase [Acidocella aminolytica 101 = DSM 11237]SHE88962.1 phosphatidylserine decarboxylase [Acidocella aminolytica 101 = DSM 11237]